MGDPHAFRSERVAKQNRIALRTASSEFKRNKREVKTGSLEPRRHGAELPFGNADAPNKCYFCRGIKLETAFSTGCVNSKAISDSTCSLINRQLLSIIENMAF